MPSIALRPCLHQPCGELVAGGGCCPTHRRLRERERGTTKERGLADGWPRLRAAKLAEDAICQIRTHCDGAVATEVDHIVPRDVAPGLRLVWSNLQSACKPCNSAKAHRIAAETDGLGVDLALFAGACK
jgi:5-methylcytosine-specific restriction enzyme A